MSCGLLRWHGLSLRYPLLRVRNGLGVVLARQLVNRSNARAVEIELDAEIRFLAQRAEFGFSGFSGNNFASLRHDHGIACRLGLGTATLRFRRLEIHHFLWSVDSDSDGWISR